MWINQELKKEKKNLETPVYTVSYSMRRNVQGSFHLRMIIVQGDILLGTCFIQSVSGHPR